MARLVLFVEVVRRIDDADAKHLRPNAIDGGAGEKRVIAGGHPFGESDAGAGLEIPARLFLIEEGGLHDLFRVGNRDLAAVEHLTQRLIEVLRPGTFDAGEKRRRGPELLAAPLGERVIVALGAFDVNPQKYASGGG